MDQDPTDEETTPTELISTDLREMRLLLYALFGLVALMAIFVVYTSWRLTQFRNDREQVLTKLDEQHQQIVCVAEATRLFDVAVADALAEQDLVPRTRGVYAERLAEVRNKIAESDRLCIIGPISSPPSPDTIAPPTAPATGTGTTSP